MVKKATKKKATKTLPAKARQAKQQQRKPRAQELPGVGVRHTDLDRLCESIGEARDSVNALRGEEKGLCQNALKQMRIHNVMSYRHAGVELMRVIGEDKLRVRTSRDDEATAGAGVAEANEAAE
jgi:hypothetical protein